MARWTLLLASALLVLSPTSVLCKWGSGGEVTAAAQEQITKLQADLKAVQTTAVQEKQRADQLAAKLRVRDKERDAYKSKADRLEVQVYKLHALEKEHAAVKGDHSNLKDDHSALLAKEAELRVQVAKLRSVEKELNFTHNQLMDAHLQLDEMRMRMQSSWSFGKAGNVAWRAYDTASNVASGIEDIAVAQLKGVDSLAPYAERHYVRSALLIVIGLLVVVLLVLAATNPGKALPKSSKPAPISTKATPGVNSPKLAAAANSPRAAHTPRGPASASILSPRRATVHGFVRKRGHRRSGSKWIIELDQ